MSETVAIEIKHDITCMAAIVRKGTKLAVEAFGYEQTTPGFFDSENKLILDGQAEILKRLFAKLKIKTRDACVVVPDAISYFEVLTMPQLKEKELLSAIRYQADEFIPMPLEEVNFDIEILQEHPEKKETSMLLVAMPKNFVQKVTTILEIAHLAPLTLENEASSIGRIFTEFLPPSEPTMIINFSSRGSSFYVFDERGTLVLTAKSRVGYDLLLRDVKANLGWTQAQVVASVYKEGLTDASQTILTIVNPVLKQLVTDITQTMGEAQELLKKPLRKVFITNMYVSVAYFAERISLMLGTNVAPLPVNSILEENPTTAPLKGHEGLFTALFGTSLR